MIKISTCMSGSVPTESNIVLFTTEKSKRPLGSYFFGTSVEKALTIAHQDGYTGKLNDVVNVRLKDNRVLRCFFSGLGPESTVTLQSVRQAVAQAVKVVNGMGLSSVYIGLPSLGFSSMDTAQSLAEGVILGLYRYTEFKTTDRSETKTQSVFILAKDAAEQKDVAAGIKKGELFARAVTFARDLVNRPPSDTPPSYLLQWAKKIAKKPVSLKIFNKNQLQKMGMGGLLGVNRGSHQPPYFLHLIYRPSSKAKKKIGICGKGITFDSGGLSLKPSASMETMKYDMSGAATVLALFQAVSALKPSIELHGFIPMTENMPGGNAVKPGDVLKAYNGKTIEVLNTDAEGRLILADALSYAGTQKLDEVFDIATLTGACVVALGKKIVGLMGNNEAFLNRFRQATIRSGEKVWELPLESEYKALLKSPIADIKNIGPVGEAGTILAGLFLQEFVPKNLPWTHLDIASTGWAWAPTSLSDTGSTGVMIRSLLTYITTQN